MTDTPCGCTLCRERAGLPVEKMGIEYEQPKVRAYGDPCTCRHCVAIRESGLQVYCGFVEWNDGPSSLEMTVHWDLRKCAERTVKWIRKDILDSAGGEEVVIAKLVELETVKLSEGMVVDIEARIIQP